MSDQRGLRIGEVAELTGTTPRTIRYYEEIGLLPAAEGRSAGAHRLYDEADVERLREVLRLKDLLGASLDELRELVAAETARAGLRSEYRSGKASHTRQREILTEALGHVDHQLELLAGRRREIESLEQELRDRRRRVRARLKELEAARTGAAR